MIKIEFADEDWPEAGCVVVLASAAGALSSAAEALDQRSQGAVRRAIKLAGPRFKGGHGQELIGLPGLGIDRLVLLPVDDPAKATPLDLEILGGRLASQLAAAGVTGAHIALGGVPGLALSQAELAIRLAAGACLRSYRFTKYRTRQPDGDDSGDGNGGNGDGQNGLAELVFHLPEPAAAAAAWRAAAAVVAGVSHGRDLVSEPGNHLTPARFADACRDLAGLGLEVEILDRAQLAELGMGALLGVAQGSPNEPYVAVMQWRGGAEGTPPVALIGKGVCFDTGGISLKPAAGMEEMKWDMGGAGAVFGAMKALAGRKAKANVVGVLGLVENMPDGKAQRPGDVVTSMAGLTIEVINTDAEGRLVLADVLHYTKERFKPQAMIDLATLTGAVVVALGNERAGLFSDDDALAERIVAAGAAVGEQVWRLPLGSDYAKHIKSDIADIKNVGRAREAGATAGAVFLQRFVGEIPWAHLDIAGVAWSKRDLGLAAKGATGFGIRLLDRLVADHYEG